MEYMPYFYFKNHILDEDYLPSGFTGSQMETNFVSEFVMTKVSIIAYLEDEICDF
jgi:hypothetical protein